MSTKIEIHIGELPDEASAQRIVDLLSDAFMGSPDADGVAMTANVLACSGTTDGTPDEDQGPTAGVYRLRPVSIGDGYRFDPDEILDAAKGQEFIELVIIGTMPTGERWVSGNCNSGQALILIERAKLKLIGGAE